MFSARYCGAPGNAPAGANALPASMIVGRDRGSSIDAAKPQHWTKVAGVSLVGKLLNSRWKLKRNSFTVIGETVRVQLITCCCHLLAAPRSVDGIPVEKTLPKAPLEVSSRLVSHR